MQWEIILAIVLAIGVGIAVKEAFEKRCTRRKQNRRVISNQHTYDADKKITDKKM